MRRRLSVALCIFALLAASAHASSVTPPTFVVDQGVTFTDVDSNFGLGDAGNDTRTATFTSIVSPDIQVLGTLTEVALGTFAGEANIDITPLGVNLDPFGSTGGYTGSISLPPGGSIVPFGGDPVGLQTFEFYESFVDDVAGPDQTWDTITINFGTVTDSGGIENGMFSIGALPDDGTMVFGPGQDGNAWQTNVAGGLDFFDFTVGPVASGGYLNIQTSDAGTGDTIDSEIGLFDSAGILVAFDDDGQGSAGGTLYSMLSFGTADPLTPMPPLGSDAVPGEDGATLAAGAYTLVVGGFDTNFEDLTIGTSTIADVLPGTSAGDYDVKLTYAVPEPASCLMFVAGVLAMAAWRRRR